MTRARPLGPIHRRTSQSGERCRTSRNFITQRYEDTSTRPPYAASSSRDWSLKQQDRAATQSVIQICQTLGRLNLSRFEYQRKAEEISENDWLALFDQFHSRFNGVQEHEITIRSPLRHKTVLEGLQMLATKPVQQSTFERRNKLST